MGIGRWKVVGYRHYFHFYFLAGGDRGRERYDFWEKDFIFQLSPLTGEIELSFKTRWGFYADEADCLNGNAYTRPIRPTRESILFDEMAGRERERMSERCIGITLHVSGKWVQDGGMEFWNQTMTA